ncbi:histone H1.03-like [Hippocampus comes]|uniref:histone H1.03-like n=1 Tax=Hippocampus comes TaxID=109280 RepID=UPI00094EF8BF|nr:PREDICTED: histone H1.03-like [Hippocampus comes]
MAEKAPASKRPSISKMILEVMAESKERKGMSVAALKKVLALKGVDVPKLNKRINDSLVRLEKRGALTQVKGAGASGSFKVTKGKPAPKTKSPKKTSSVGLKSIQKVGRPKKPTPSSKKRNSLTSVKKYVKPKQKPMAKKSETSARPRKSNATAKPKQKLKIKPTQAKLTKKPTGKKGTATKKPTVRKTRK